VKQKEGKKLRRIDREEEYMMQREQTGEGGLVLLLLTSQSRVEQKQAVNRGIGEKSLNKCACLLP